MTSTATTADRAGTRARTGGPKPGQPPSPEAAAVSLLDCPLLWRKYPDRY